MPVTDEMIYAALEVAIARDLLPRGGSPEENLNYFHSMKAILQAAIEAA